MSTGVSIQSFDPSLLLNYYQAQLPIAPTQSAAPPTASSSSATANDAPPWDASTTPSQQAEDAQVLSITNFMDTANVPLSTAGADGATEQDNQKLFSLYQAVNNLSYLASMSQRTGMTAGQLAGFNSRFQTGLSQVENYLSTTTFKNFTLQASQPGASTTSQVAMPFQTYNYAGSTLVSDANLANPLFGVSASDSFTISVAKGGTTTNVPIDLSQVKGPLTLDNIVSYVNQQLQSDGFSTRFQRVITQGSENDPQAAYYGLQINELPNESVTLSSAAATPALYVAGTNGSLANTATNTTSSNGTPTTAQQISDQQGRLTKLSNLSGTPQTSFIAETTPSSGATTAQATAVDANGDVYVVGNATGDLTNQVNQGSQDVYLSKYDFGGSIAMEQIAGQRGQRHSLWARRRSLHWRCGGDWLNDGRSVDDRGGGRQHRQLRRQLRCRWQSNLGSAASHPIQQPG